MNGLTSRLSAGVAAFAALVLLTGCRLGYSNMGGFKGASICGLIILVLDVLAIIEIINSDRDSTNKLIWCLVIFFMPLVGLLLYYFIGRRG
jgi:hypothetical protein